MDFRVCRNLRNRASWVFPVVLKKVVEFQKTLAQEPLFSWAHLIRRFPVNKIKARKHYAHPF